MLSFIVQEYPMDMEMANYYGRNHMYNFCLFQSRSSRANKNVYAFYAWASF